MRKDLHMSPGKLAAQVGHCAEAYWTNLIRSAEVTFAAGTGAATVPIKVPQPVWEKYILGSFTKTICEAKNKSKLLNAKEKALKLGLREGIDFGLIYDNCYTELTPEEEDGTTLTGIWFGPLSEETAHEISKKYQLYH